MFTALLTLPLVCRDIFPLLRENLQKLQCFDVWYLNSKENVIFVPSNAKEVLMEFQQALRKITTAAGCFSRNETLLRTNSKMCNPGLFNFYVWNLFIFYIPSNLRIIRIIHPSKCKKYNELLDSNYILTHLNL